MNAAGDSSVFGPLLLAEHGPRASLLAAINGAQGYGRPKKFGGIQ